MPRERPWACAWALADRNPVVVPRAPLIERFFASILRLARLLLPVCFARAGLNFVSFFSVFFPWSVVKFGIPGLVLWGCAVIFQSLTVGFWAGQLLDAFESVPRARDTAFARARVRG